MKKIALALVLAAVSGAAMAGWVATGESYETKHYVDPATSRRSGDMVKLWALVEFQPPRKAPSGALYLSSTAQNEYDCRGERSRRLYVTFHPGKMGEGAPVFTLEEPGEWTQVMRGSIIETQWKLACGKR